MGSLSRFLQPEYHAISFDDTASRDSSLDSLDNSPEHKILRFLIFGLVFET